MRNPLNKRLLRELTGDIGKYIVIFVLLVFSIGFVSGFLVAGESMIKAYYDSFEKYSIEDGHFRTEEELTDSQKKWIEKKGVTVYGNFYAEKEFDNETKLRIFADRKEVDKVCVMEGRLPKEDNEIAIDRMYADKKFSAYSLKTTGEGGTRIEDVTLYGIEEDSRFVHADFDEKTVLVSSSYADKYNLKKGSVITLKEPYEDRYYGFKVRGIYDYDGGIVVFMSKKHLNDILGFEEDFFSGYFSDTEITDIESKYIGTVVDEESLTRVSRQLMISMGSLMYMIDAFSVVMFIVLIYLLSKLIIERNVQSISMAKILGYSKIEIAKLYIIPTAIVVVVSLLISYPVLSYVMVGIFRVMLKQMMSGWMNIWLDPKVYVEMFLMGIITYAVVAVAEYRKIGLIPMSEALKNVE